MSASSIPSSSPGVTPVTVDFDSNIVQQLVNQSAMNVAKKMLTDIIEGMKQNSSVKAITENHIYPKLEEDLSNSDKMTQLIYKKLFDASMVYIQQHSATVLVPIFAMMDKATDNDETSGRFICSYVLAETREMIKTLQEKAPDALKCQVNRE